ncbi:MAG: response regulator [Nanoarchaeota archaeon]|nr:response regulator [Nanoarchaeota archaeon]
MNILCVDDEQFIHFSLARWYKIQPSVKFYSAHEGDEGLVLARGIRPDIILLDCNIPGMSGIEFYRIARADPVLRSTPIIAIGEFPEEMLPEFDAVFAKSSYFDTATLDRVIQEVLSKRPARIQ